VQLLSKEIGCYCSCLAEKPGYDTGEFVMEMREKMIAPHVAQITNGRRSAIDNRTTVMPALRSPSAFANASRKLSAGPRS
jgi:hypothetical protein